MPADEGPVGETQGGGAGKPVSRSVRQAFLVQRRPIIFILIFALDSGRNEAREKAHNKFAICRFYALPGIRKPIIEYPCCLIKLADFVSGQLSRMHFKRKHHV